MRFDRVIAVLLGAVLGVSCATATPENEWTSAYRRDLDSARDTIAANHPGYVDEQNPSFRAAMGSAYDEARGAAVRDYDSYRVALTRFANRFQDAHLSIRFEKPFESLRDAGIVVAYRGGQFVVEEADTRYGERAGAMTGATLVSCGGEPAREHFARRVLSWRGRANIEADWYNLAPILLVDYAPPAPDPPTRCQFAVAGNALDLPLLWNATTPERVAQMLAPPSAGRTLSIEPMDDVLWVNIPMFSVNDEASIAQMRALIEDAGRQVEARRDWRLIVFDLRGNSGGSATWGRQIATKIFGEAWVRDANHWLGDGVYTEWRVSPENVATIGDLVRQNEQRHGVDSSGAKSMRNFETSMKEALGRRDNLLSDPRQREGVVPPVAAPGPAKRIVLITTPSCFSACLDFVDLMRLHPSVVQTGLTTGVDTLYMENWGKPLPSGNARISYPMKVYRNRRRGNNEAYVPAVAYPGNLDDTAALKAWVLGRDWRR